MKFQKFTALEKHLTDAHAEHLSKIYLIAAGRSAEREQLMELAASAIKLKHSYSQLKRINGVKEALHLVNTGSLFGQRLILVVDVNKEEMPLFKNSLSLLTEGIYWVLGMENSKQAQQLYQLAERDILFLDLSSEKPWERHQRVNEWTNRKFAKAGKKTTSQVIEDLVVRCDLDVKLIEQEIEKLICYVGERQEISLDDLSAVSVHSLTQISGFQIGEKLVEGTLLSSYRVEDISGLLTLIGQLRYLFEMGLKVCGLLEKGENQETIMHYLPKATDKSVRIIKKRNNLFFKIALSLLFELELSAKQGLSNPQLLFNYFCAKLQTSGEKF